jgi:hypothetical protein
MGDFDLVESESSPGALPEAGRQGIMDSSHTGVVNCLVIYVISQAYITCAFYRQPSLRKFELG